MKRRDDFSASDGLYDLAVIGAGSGGFGAALTAARLGLRVALIEKGEWLGGNAVRGGVNNWEMGAGGTGVPFDLYCRLRAIPQAIAVTSLRRHMLYTRPGDTPFPGGEWVVDPTRGYLDTLHRHGTRGMAQDEAAVRERWHSVVFEPEACDRVMRAMLEETGHCTIRTGVAFSKLHRDGRRVEAVTLDDGSTLRAVAFIDSTADAKLIQAAGHPVMLGEEPRSRFDEPDAPPVATPRLNATTLIYRITPSKPPAIEPLPSGVPEECWWAPRFPVASFTQYPCGDFNVNMLPTMAGQETRALGHSAAYAECRRRVLAHWHDLQVRHEEFRGYRLTWVARTLGVREGPRIVGRYVLTQHDLLAGLAGQDHGDIITLADHAMDVHGSGSEGSRCPELAEPYGVPLRCLIPRDLDNVLVACRGASFSAIAASSCRLSRTMMQLGQAAGTAVAVARDAAVAPADVDPSAVREALRLQGVQLDHPMPVALRESIRIREGEALKCPPTVTSCRTGGGG